jgi:hypothetical protein
VKDAARFVAVAREQRSTLIAALTNQDGVDKMEEKVGIHQALAEIH